MFANPSSGWAVVELDVGGGSRPRATGPLAALVEGQPVRLLGQWVNHPQHGPTFDALAYELAEPRSADGLEAFLASDHFDGVGPVLAGRLVERFGLRLGEVLATEPEQLHSVPGISPAKASRIAAAWSRAGALAGVVTALTDVGAPLSAARAAVRMFGDDAARLIDEDPYALLVVPRLAFRHADALGHRAGIPPDDPRRLRAAGQQAVAAPARDGHTWCEEGEARAICRSLVGGDVDAGAALTAAADAGTIVAADATATGAVGWALAGLDAAEQGIAEDVHRLLANGRPWPSGPADQALAGLTAAQAAAVAGAWREGVSVLTGGPGTGKTRTIQAVVAACAAAERSLALCAPTGRAARRLEEVTGHRAATIHRLLEARPDDGGFRFGRDADEPLEVDLVVADEWSMTDVRLARALLQALPDGCHLLCVGDADQLPPVGPGAPLRDLIASTEVGVTHLDVVHRQAAGSRIVTLAHEINAGTLAALAGRDGDVFCVPEQPQGVGARVAEIVATRAPDYFSCTPADVQVLAPMYRGPAGVHAVNDAIKERLNPTAGRPMLGGFCEGDRVVVTRNDVELDVANGDIGDVLSVDKAQRALEVGFAQGTVTFASERIADLAPAWCLTVHRAQGGEWPVVVLLLDRAHRAMLTRDLVYTAVSRARSGLLLLGQPDQLVAAARRTDRGLRTRRTTLSRRLQRSGSS